MIYMIAFAGMAIEFTLLYHIVWLAQWSASISLTGQLAFISQLVGIFKIVSQPAGNECISAILHIR